MKQIILFLSAIFIICLGEIFPQYIRDDLEGTHQNAFTKVEPPSIFAHRQVLGKVATSDFQIIYEGSTPPIDAQNAIGYAVNIWEFLINTAFSQTIKIRVRWADLGYSSTAGFTLAKCGPDSFYNSSSLPHPNIQYPISLAEYLLDQNLNEDSTEMTITINSHDSVKWYYGTDGIPQSNKHDLISTVLHEIAHGLGFSSSFYVEDSYGYFGWEDLPVDTNLHPAIYDLFGAVGSYYPNADLLINYTNGSTQLKQKLTSNNVFFNGDNAWLQNGHYLLPKLYVPSSWDQGSSFTHLDDATYPPGNSNSLMTHSQDDAEVIHSPGEVGLAILKDIGWNINRLATFTHPGLGIALKKNTVDTIKWTDNEGGSYSLVLLDSLDNFVMTVCTLGTASEGSNQYIWTVPASVTNGKYRIKVQFGGAFGISGMFTITDQQQVAAPVFNPTPGAYLNPVTVTCSTSTPGATIRYTTNGTEPNGSSTIFPALLVISTQTTIKAKAFKSGMIESNTTTGVYSIGAQPPVPEITPLSGTHPDGSKWTLSWTPGTRCFMNWTNDGSEPFDPSIPGHQYEEITNPVRYTFTGLYPIKVKARAYLNGNWSSMVERDYIIVPAVRIAQVDDEITGNNSFGKWKNWEGFWKEYLDTILARPSNTTDYFLLAQQNYKEGTTKKYNFWGTDQNVNYFINHGQVPIGANTSVVLAHFKDTKNVTIKNWLEGSVSVNSGNFSFRDPWLIDDYSDSKGPRNRGLNPQWVSLTYSTTPNITTGSNHMGIFLNHNPEFNPDIPIYKIWAGDTQLNLGGSIGTRNFYFQNWIASGANLQVFGDGKEVWPVFTSESPTVTANYKGTGLSNNPNAYTNNSQRKFVKSPNGDLHNVYPSLGHVWYERSTDAGNTWTLANDGNYLDNGEGKLPSVDENGDAIYGDNSVLIVYQEKNGNNYQIKLKKFNSGALTSEAEVYSSSQSYNTDANPVVAYSNNTTSNDKFIVVFQTNQGLYYRYGYIYTGLITWPLIEPTPEGILNGTDQYSLNPTIAAWKNAGGQGDFHLAWQKNNQIYYKIIHYVDDEITNDPPPINISSNTGYSEHYYPSIIEMPGTSARVCWVGFRMVYPKDIELDAFPQYKVLFKSPQNPGSFWQFGNNVSSPNINKQNDNTYYAFGWSEGLNEIKFADNSLSTVRAISEVTGQNLQISNGPDKNNMFCMAYEHNAGIPYFFERSNKLGSFYPPQKITSNLFSSGREGAISIDDAGFYFAIGDIIIDGQPIDFIELADTILVNNLTTLNEYLVTVPVNINNNSSFIYSVQYGITDSLAASQAITEDRFINFKAQLVDNNTGEIIGEYDNVTFNSENIYNYNNVAYQVNTQGIGNRTVRLKLALNNNFISGYSLSQIYSDETVLDKSNIQEINFNGKETIISYDLFQNYPNPFNPTTIINYQIPEDGRVTLKIYDILGKEVKTLLNEQKPTGRYEINFDASNLASGVYIYRIQVNDYVSSKKMMLLK